MGSLKSSMNEVMKSEIMGILGTRRLLKSSGSLRCFSGYNHFEGEEPSEEQQPSEEGEKKDYLLSL